MADKPDKPARHPASLRNLKVPDSVRNRRVYSQAETLKHRADVEAMFVEGKPAAVIRAFMRRRYKVGEARANRLLDLVKQSMIRDDELTRDANRSTAIRRVQSQIQDIAGRLLEKQERVVTQGRGKSKRQVLVEVERPDADYARLHTVRLQYERLLSDLQGTREPIRISLDVQVTHGIMQVISTMSPEEVAQKLAQHAEMQRQASLYRQLTAGSTATVQP